MSQKDFNRDIDSYINRRRTDEKPVDLERIRKQAGSQGVDELHPGLSKDRVHVIAKDDPWLKRIVNSVTKKDEAIARQDSELPVEADKEFEEEEQKLERELGTTYWSRFVNWLKGRDEAVDDFEEKMEELDEKEHELVRKEQELAHEETELAEERVSAVRGFWDRFRPGRQNQALQEQLYDMQEDLKRVAKITTTVMRQIPAEQLHQYKQSNDFIEFKDILKRHNLIKESSEESEQRTLDESTSG
jgi:hypothetical protein